MALTKEKVLYSTELLTNGNMQSLYKIRVYEGDVLISDTNHREVIPPNEANRIKAVCGEVVLNQLKQINDKNEEIKKIKDEKAVLNSEKLALLDEVDLLKSEKEEIKIKKE